jgi:putative membrane protein
MYGDSWFGYGGCPFWGGYGFSVWHFLIMMGVVIIIATIIFLALKKNGNKENQAIRLLKELYAKGEISEEEYLKRKEVIER